MNTAGGFSDSTCRAQPGTFSGSVVTMYMTPQKYRVIRRKNGMSSLTSATLPPIRATISAAPVLNSVCSATAGTSRNQYQVSGEPLTWYWFLLVPAVALQTLFNTGAALIVARMGGSVADVSELIPFFLRITRYFCGVMYMVTTLPEKVPGWALQVLSLNPPAVFISLVRVALLKSYRTNAPGNAPYDPLACAYFHKDPG